MSFAQKLNRFPGLCSQNRQEGTSNVHKNTESREFLPISPIFSLEKCPETGQPIKKPALEKTLMLSVSKTGSFLTREFNRTSVSHSGTCESKNRLPATPTDARNAEQPGTLAQGAAS
jgi:hypothetical protein